MDLVLYIEDHLLRILRIKLSMNNIFSKKFNKLKGSVGEDIALNYIKKHLKYKILETNYTCDIGEIDIIAKDNKIVVFIEVKYRSSDIYGLPREAVNAAKQRKIKQTAISYLKYNNLYESVDVRFDVVDILDDKVTYIEDAF